jgi:hypothetical protein
MPTPWTVGFPNVLSISQFGRKELDQLLVLAEEIRSGHPLRPPRALFPFFPPKALGCDSAAVGPVVLPPYCSLTLPFFSILLHLNQESTREVFRDPERQNPCLVVLRAVDTDVLVVPLRNAATRRPGLGVTQPLDSENSHFSHPRALFGMLTLFAIHPVGSVAKEHQNVVRGQRRDARRHGPNARVLHRRYRSPTSREGLGKAGGKGLILPAV